jgi:cytochrome c oxidase assembly protein subunit 15
MVKMKSLIILRRLTTIAMLVSLIVVMLGAYTRLTHAGLGCPDWPGCYGHLAVASLSQDHSASQAQFPDAPIETKKAWTEMIHRYIAGSLVLLVLLMNVCVWRANRAGQHVPWTIPLVLVGLIGFQALLGMWTVTLKLLPLVVVGHLLGGILIFSSLCYLRLTLSGVRQADNPRWRFWMTLGVLFVLCQIALGGWVSSNYAGIACIGFPQCNGQWWPHLNFTEAFRLFLPVGVNYQGGVLDAEARLTIQFVHRLGAMMVATYLLVLSIWLWLNCRFGRLRIAAGFTAALVMLQFSLGIANVVYLLPLPIAVLHNGVAAMLLAICFMMRYLVSGEAKNASTF